MGTLAQRTKDFADMQWKQANSANSMITCECDDTYPLLLMYRCLYCKMYLCEICAEIHFGQTVNDYFENK